MQGVHGIFYSVIVEVCYGLVLRECMFWQLAKIWDIDA